MQFVSSSESDDACGARKITKSKSFDRARKLELRKQRNRDSAAASRKRKNDRIVELEAVVAAIAHENAVLRQQVQQQGAGPFLPGPSNSGCPTNFTRPSLSRR